MARTSVDPDSLLKPVSQAVWAIDPGVGIRDSGSIEDSLKTFYRGPRFQLFAMEVFAVSGLILVAFGVFSVMAYSVSLRTRELGIRVALGAQRPEILRLVMGNGFALLAVGTLLGVCASLGLTQFLASQIGSVSPNDPLTFALVVVVIVSVGLAACYIPARRAMSVDPMVALRHE
ncbi:MAG: FtsX-like permease family protein [Candidatus Acidiferrales bacterium]